jgi:hypothetical protein
MNDFTNLFFHLSYSGAVKRAISCTDKKRAFRNVILHIQKT